MVAFYLFQRLAHAFYLSRGFGFDKQQGNAVNEKDNVLPDGSLAIGKPELVRYMKGVAVDIAGIEQGNVAFPLFGRDKHCFQAL
ncbi:MAG: hypothetical protein BWX51_01876 [Bacteroidetes bacterium ADurb.Bin012]|nr:MAG: hypothetical protein BWX51_01876 [Bacteroidetes bacterium ADurb.Bin012]